MSKKKDLIIVILFAVLIYAVSIANVITPDKEISNSERRRLAQSPKLKWESVMNTLYMQDFEKYVSDQFVLRDELRNLYSMVSKYVFAKRDINGIYVTDGYASKIEKSINESSVEWGTNRINFIYDKYLENSRVYFAVIPDKAYYLHGIKNYPYIDYDIFVSSYLSKMNKNIEFIDIRPALNLESYYYTDTHWSQDKILPVADILLTAIAPQDKNNLYKNEVAVKSVDSDFYGVYANQVAPNMKPETIRYLVNKDIDEYEVYCYDTGKAERIPVYNDELAKGKDSYEMFLNGPRSLISIQNPNAANDKKLIVFRDSFGSSLAPLLALSYRETILVDIRYLSPVAVGRFVDFDDADVLFMYSVLVLNNCEQQFLP